MNFQQQPQYGAPQGQYGAPGAPPGQYGAPQGQYGAPGAPQGQYGAPQGQYGAPQGQYGAPQGQQYNAPQGQYGGPQPGQYGAPQGQQYGAPQGQYGGPQPGQYGAPQGQHGAPQGQYGAPQGQHGHHGAYPGQQMSMQHGGHTEVVSFRTHHGQQLQAHGDGVVKVDTCPVSDWERFTLEYQPDGTVYIRTSHNTYVNREDNGIFRGVPTKHDSDSRFTIVPQPQRGHNKVALRTARGTWVQAPPTEDGALKDSGNLGDWEIFEKMSV